MDQTVWIVVQDQDADNTVLGVFNSEAEASNLAEDVAGRFNGKVLFFPWVVGARFDEGTRTSTFRI